MIKTLKYNFANGAIMKISCIKCNYKPDCTVIFVHLMLYFRALLVFQVPTGQQANQDLEAASDPRGLGEHRVRQESQ